MDRYLLFYIIVLIWLLPFSFGHSSVCMDGSLHKKVPGPESELFSQCSPWKHRSCCTNGTSRSVHAPLHHNFNIDHCSHVRAMSSHCRRHFIQDLCFYECSPNVGPWIVKVNMKIRRERFYQVPLCPEDCRAWFEDCKFDLTCSSNWLTGWKWTSAGNQCRQNSPCYTFQQVFSNATSFCEKVWDGSWKVAEEGALCMTLWFDAERGNPNTEVSRFYAEERHLQISAAGIQKVSFATVSVVIASLFCSHFRPLSFH